MVPLLPASACWVLTVPPRWHLLMPASVSLAQVMRKSHEAREKLLRLGIFRQVDVLIDTCQGRCGGPMSHSHHVWGLVSTVGWNWHFRKELEGPPPRPLQTSQTPPMPAVLGAPVGS